MTALDSGRASGSASSHAMLVHTFHEVWGCTDTPRDDFGLGASTNIVTEDIECVPSVKDEGHRDPSARCSFKSIFTFPSDHCLPAVIAHLDTRPARLRTSRPALHRTSYSPFPFALSRHPSDSGLITLHPNAARRTPLAARQSNA
jgi:hypothetical protein